MSTVVNATATDEVLAAAKGAGVRLMAERWWHVVRYHRPGQLAARLRNICRRRMERGNAGSRYAREPHALPVPRENPGFRRILEHRLAARTCPPLPPGEGRGEGNWQDGRLFLVPLTPTLSQRERGHEILQGRFSFLNQSHDLHDPIDWRLDTWPDAPRLWRFHLHYHEFLLDLATAGLVEPAWRIVGQWIDQNRPGDAVAMIDAWHPYCISRRLPVWMLLWHAAMPSDDAARRQVLASMVAQARFLADHLEHDLGGNHLLDNARALAMLGAFFEGPLGERWLKAAARILNSELDEQILPHGEHFERSPMYHALMLDAVLDVRDATAAVMSELAARCDEIAQRMAVFLQAIVHPDGQIPLLGDSALGETPPIDLLLQRALRPSPLALRPSPSGAPLGSELPSPRVGDYWVFRAGGDFLLFDAGPVGPDHLPAHAHADLLGIEASVAGRRLLVDSGVFDYEDGAMRRYCRSSKAHNVLVIDDVDQCDMWSRFRMGRRGWPTGFACGAENGIAWARATHNAYRRQGVPVVGRWLACRPGGPWCCVDWAAGKPGRTFRLASRLHLHPDVQAEMLSSSEIRLHCGDTTLRLRYGTPGEVRLAGGWYCPEFGRRVACLVIEWIAATALPAACAWQLSWGDTPTEDHALQRLADRVMLEKLGGFK